MGEVSLIGPKLVQDSMQKVWYIREKLKKTHSWQKSYADVRRMDLEFDVSDWV